MNKATSADDILNTTIIEGLADDVCPVSKTLAEISITTDLVQDLLLNSNRRILLLKGHREPLKECFVEHVSSNESSIVRSFAFGIGSCEYVKTFWGRNPLANLLEENSFPFKNRLKTEDFVWGEVDLVKEQHSTPLQGFNDGSIVPNGLSVNKTETTNKIIFISLYRDVDSDEFTSELSTRLFDRKRFAIARETRDKRRVK